MSWPRLSVLLVVDGQGRRGGAAALDRSLASIAAQDLAGDVEVVVADDGPADPVRDAVVAWAQRAGRTLRPAPHATGPAAAPALHRGLGACRGRFVAVLRAGDRWTAADALGRRVALLESAPDLVGAGTGAAGAPVPALSGLVVRADVLERLDPGIGEVPGDHDLLLVLALGAHGEVATLPGPDVDLAAHAGTTATGVAAVVAEHGHLWGPSEPGGRPAAAPTDAPTDATGPGGRHGVVVLDDYFPTLVSGFRNAEYNWMLRHGVAREVMTTVAGREELVAEYGRLHPWTVPSISGYDARRLAEFECASILFLNNAISFLPDLERHGLPFVLTLYPGGGLHLGEPAAERKLRRVLSSPVLRHVITTQPLVTELVERLSGGTVPTTEVYGVVVDPTLLQPGPGLRTNYLGAGKDHLDIGFVAQKYTPDGADKGFPVFLRSVAELTAAGLPVRAHVVGGFGPDDVGDACSAEGITFHGLLDTARLRELYLGMDVVVSPVAPGRIAPGSFDGFPTGACVEAALCGVAVVATDPLDQNRVYTDGRDVHLPPAEVDAVTQRIRSLVETGVRPVAHAGLRTTRRAYGIDAQLRTRRAVVEATLAAVRSAPAPAPVVRPEPLVSVLLVTRDDRRNIRAALRSVLEQTHRTLEVLVLDSGSVDGTADVLHSVAADDPRVRVLTDDPGAGAAAGLRRLLGEAQGPYVKVLEPDDTLTRDCVRDLVRALEEHPHAVAAFAHRVLVDQDGRPVPGHSFTTLADRPGIGSGRILGNHALVHGDDVVGGLSAGLFHRADVVAAVVGSVDGEDLHALVHLRTWLELLAQGPYFCTPRPLVRVRQRTGARIAPGREEREWALLVDWATRHGYLSVPGDLARARATALLRAATCVARTVADGGHGHALEAAHLAVALLAGTAGASADPRPLPARVHDAAARARTAQDLSALARTYPVAVAAPRLDQAEVDVTVQALRDLLAAGAAERAVVAVPAGALDTAVPLLEAALAAGADVDFDVVPDDDPARMLPGPWLAVTAPGRSWDRGQAQGVWTTDPVPRQRRADPVHPVA